MQKAELVFGSYIRHPAFLRDFIQFFRLNKEELTKCLNTYLQSKYRRHYIIHPKRISEELNVSISQAGGIIQVLDFLAYPLATRFKDNDIIEAVKELEIEGFNEKVFREFLATLSSDKNREILRNLDLIDDEIGSIIPHFRDITYSLEQRMVKKDGEIIRKLPVALLQVTTSDEDEASNVVELLEDDIDAMMDILQDIKIDLKNLEKDN